MNVQVSMTEEEFDQYRNFLKYKDKLVRPILDIISRCKILAPGMMRTEETRRTGAEVMVPAEEFESVAHMAKEIKDRAAEIMEILNGKKQ